VFSTASYKGLLRGVGEVLTKPQFADSLKRFRLLYSLLKNNFFFLKKIGRALLKKPESELERSPVYKGTVKV
jgi:hypothetical protein